MKIFITGATGFIGTHLVNRLARTKHKICCLVLGTNQVDTLKELGTELIEGDVTNKASIIEGMSGCDWVVHLANIYSFWEPDKRLYSKVNVEGTQNLMECALETGVKKVIHIGTSLIYGKPAVHPFTEESAVGPIRFSTYAQSKYEGDLIIWEMLEKKGLPVVVIYPAGVLGPGNPKASGLYIRDLIHRRLPATVFHDSTLTWVHVRDVAEGILRALEKDNNIGEKYLLGTESLSMQQFNELVRDISGIPLPRLRMPDTLAMLTAALLTWIANLTKKPPMWGMAADAMRMIKEGIHFDGSKAERELGLTYTPIREAIEDDVSSYKVGGSV
ncbi:MAG: NAD-dependent epimerase/dehydratase family protein [Desulfobacterales bacterium]|jgi:dihydroflavonol-4-reductase